MTKNSIQFRFLHFANHAPHFLSVAQHHQPMNSISTGIWKEFCSADWEALGGQFEAIGLVRDNDTDDAKRA